MNDEYKQQPVPIYHSPQPQTHPHAQYQHQYKNTGAGPQQYGTYPNDIAYKSKSKSKK